MRLRTKFAAFSLLSAMFLTTIGVTDTISPQKTHHVVYAEDNGYDVDAIAGLEKFNKGRAMTQKEKTAIRMIVYDPIKYFGSKTSKALREQLKTTIRSKGTELADALGLNATLDFSKISVELERQESVDTPKTDGTVNVTNLPSSATDKTGLFRDDRWQTLYPSVIYSLSKGESADSTKISLAQLSRYPVIKEAGSSDKSSLYGNLATPGWNAKPTSTGQNLSTYLATLYEYNYLVTKDVEGLSGFWDSLTGAVSNTVRTALLSTAFLGAGMYAGSKATIDMITDGMLKINVISIFGLDKATEAVDNWLNNLITGALSTVGLTPEFIRAMQYLFYVVLIGAFIITLISHLNRAKNKQAMLTLKRNSLKILTIMMTIPIMSMMYTATSSVMNEMGKFADKASSDVTTNYVIDVTKWAGTLNLSLAPISTANFGTNLERNATYAPTPDNIGKLNNAIRAKDFDSKKDSSGAEGAMESISSLMSDKLTNVNSYFDYISSHKSSGTGIAAEIMPVIGGVDNQSNIMQLVSRDKGEDPVKEVIKSVATFFGFGSKDGSKSDEEDSVKVKTGTYYVDNKQVDIGLKSKFDLVPVVWNQPDSYIYGATQPGNLTKSTKNHGNYHISGVTDMLKDPNTGELAKDEGLSDALMANYSNYALTNKFAGVANVGGVASLSTQSVAMLLQTKYSNKSLMYKGFNTAANAAGQSKNTGQYGIMYVNYVVPSSDIFDYMGKIAGINVVWMTAGMTAFIVLLAILKTPLLGGLLKHFTGFFAALFGGNVISLLESVVYYIAMILTGVTAYFAISVSLSISMGVLKLPFINQLAVTASFVPIIAPILLSILTTFILTYPVVNLKLGVSNKSRKVGIAELLVSVFFILAESLDEYLNKFSLALYGESHSQSFMSKMKRQVSAIDQGSQLKEKVKGAINKGVSAARIASGDVLGGTRQLLGGMGEEDPNDPNSPNAQNEDEEELKDGVVTKDPLQSADDKPLVEGALGSLGALGALGAVGATKVMSKKVVNGEEAEIIEDAELPEEVQDVQEVHELEKLEESKKSKKRLRSKDATGVEGAEGVEGVEEVEHIPDKPVVTNRYDDEEQSNQNESESQAQSDGVSALSEIKAKLDEINDTLRNHKLKVVSDDNIDDNKVDGSTVVNNESTDNKLVAEDKPTTEVDKPTTEDVKLTPEVVEETTKPSITELINRSQNQEGDVEQNNAESTIETVKHEEKLEHTEKETISDETVNNTEKEIVNNTETEKETVNTEKETVKNTEKETVNNTEKETVNNTEKETVNNQKETVNNQKETVNNQKETVNNQKETVKNTEKRPINVPTASASVTTNTNDATKVMLQEQAKLLKAQMNAVAHPVQTVKNVANATGIPQVASAVRNSDLARSISDSITASMSKMSVEQVKMMKAAERSQRDAMRDAMKEMASSRKNVQIENNKQFLKETVIEKTGQTENVAKALAGVQSVVGSKPVQTVAKGVSLASMPAAYAIDRMFFDGESVMTKAMRGQRTDDKVYQSNQPNRKEDNDGQYRKDRREDEYRWERTKELEQLTDSLDDLTNTLNRQNKQM